MFPAERTRRALGRAALALAVLAPAPAWALDAAPWTLALSATRARPGEAVTVRVTPRGAATAARHDLYIVWGLAQAALFLTPDGAWAERPVAWHAGVSAADATPLESTWPAGPPGEIQPTLVVVRAGGDPLARADWAFAPRVAWLTVERPRPAGAPRWPPGLALPAFAALVGSAVVLLVRPRPRG
jgi:hypothetical protein